jgi:hypothetical protein
MRINFIPLCVVGSFAITLLIGCSSDEQGTELELVTDPGQLNYQLDVRLDGLDEDVSIHKNPEYVWITRASGEPASYEDLLSSDRDAYRARYGALPKDLHEELRAADPDETFIVSLRYFVDTTPQVTTGAQADAGTIAAALAVDVQPILATMADEGLTPLYVATYAPLITIEASAEQVLEFAHDPRIKTIYDDRLKPGQELAIQPAVHHEIDVEYGQPGAMGSYATAVKVGVIEANLYDTGDQAGCGINETHVAFSEAQITYNLDPQKCNPNNPTCPAACDLCVDMNYPGPLSGHCVADHPNYVSSLISNTQSAGNPYAAARAELFLANHATPCGGGGSALIYDWFVAQGVRTANASYYECDGKLADEYIRDYDLFIARGAGNFPTAAACESSASSLCVGASNADRNVSCFSSWLNPANFAGEDREEPDVVVFGGTADRSCTTASEPGAVQYASATTTNTWGSDVGTSLAAPTATAMAALLREECGDANGWTDRVLRAIFRTAGRAHNSHGTRYSTPNTLDNDGHDGGGWVGAQELSAFCDPGGDNAGEGTFNLQTGDGSTFDSHGSFPPGNPPEGLEPASPEVFRAFTDPGVGRVYHVIKHLPVIPAGTRVRATISWDACTGIGNVGIAARDIDLFLFRVDSSNGNDYEGVWVTGSQSVYDVNEGFDFEVSQADDYIIVAGWPAGVGCDGSATEPFGYAYWAWVP